MLLRLKLRLSSGLLIAIALTAADHPKFKETNKATADPAIPAYKSGTTTPATIRVVGADTMEDLMKIWIADFRKLHPDVQFTMEAKGSTTGIPALTSGTADLAPVAREPLPDEAKNFHAKYGYDPFAIAVAGGSYRTPGKTHAIDFFVHKENPIDKLTLAQLDAIYSVTNKRGYRAVKTWGDLGLSGDWANAPIHLYGVRRPNGIADFVQMRVLEGGEYKPIHKEYHTEGAVPALDAIVDDVAHDKFGIGYAGLTNLKANSKIVALAPAPGGPYYQASFEEVLKQQYPLSREIYFYVNRAPGKAIDANIAEFIRFVLSSQGQAGVVKEGVFLPLPASYVNHELAKLK
jgi:phosphate transport system substrate-binding protein